MAALEVYRTGLDKFPNDVCLLTGMARIYEAINNISLSTKYYKIILNEDAINVEAIACIGKIQLFIPIKHESSEAESFYKIKNRSSIITSKVGQKIS